MNKRINYNSNSPWEDVVGYCRMVQVGAHIEISGTVAADESGQVIGKDNAYEQTKFILEKIEKSLVSANASLKDVVRTRMFVTDISKFKEYAKAHKEAFINIKPCTSMIEVKALISPNFLIEIEATAILSEKG